MKSLVSLDEQKRAVNNSLQMHQQKRSKSSKKKSHSDFNLQCISNL